MQYLYADLIAKVCRYGKVQFFYTSVKNTSQAIESERRQQLHVLT